MTFRLLQPLIIFKISVYSYAVCGRMTEKMNKFAAAAFPLRICYIKYRRLLHLWVRISLLRLKIRIYLFSNVLEEIVKDRTDRLIKDIDMCKCERCRLDACAIALNSLTPKYVTTSKGALLSKVGYINLEYRMEIDVQVLKALKLVKENPRHGK